MNTSVYQGSELDVFSHAVNWKSYLTKHIKPFIHGNVLEVGAGLGAATKTLTTSKYSTWTCLEPDPELAKRLSKNININPGASEIEVIVGMTSSINKLNFYNTIIYIDVLEHIEYDRDELLRAKDLLSKDGTLVILSPAHQWLYSEFDREIGHYRRYTRQTLINAIPHGFLPVQIRYLDSIGAMASLANRMLLRSAKPALSQVKFWDKIMVPMSSCIDPLILYSFGKSVLGIWKKTEA